MSGGPTSFEPLARLILGDGYRGGSRERWVGPLAQLLAAASRGRGHLPRRECPLDDDAPEEFFAVRGDRVLLPRNARFWDSVRVKVEALHACPPRALDDTAIRQALEQILPPMRELTPQGQVLFDNFGQRLMAAAFVDAKIGVLTGGPGTGKTTSVSALLAIRKRLEPGLAPSDVLLCAPTGKAACRLGESIRGAAHRLPLEPAERDFLLGLSPLTIHRALEWSTLPPEQGGPYRRHCSLPLEQRLVVVDEASMLDLELMTHLLEALSADASLLLLGDSDQLESVEVGGVLAELVARGSAAALTEAQRARCERRLGQTLSEHHDRGGPTATDASALPGLVHCLRHSYRAKLSPWLLELSALARPGSPTTVVDFLAICRKWAPNTMLHPRRSHLYGLCREQWGRSRRETLEWRLEKPPDSSQLQAHLRRFQLLVGSNAQVERANRLGLSVLLEEPNHAPGFGLPHGCPVLVTQNRPALGLSNGDVGIALGCEPLPVAQGVVFPGLERPVPMAQLPEHQAAFALTIHKSQGSEWDRVAIDLPDEGELLDRNLLYTALTRSRHSLDLYASEGTLKQILETTLPSDLASLSERR